MTSESLGPVDSTESLQEIYDEACALFTERYGAPTLNNILWDAGLTDPGNLNNKILTLKFYDENYCGGLVGDDGKPLQPIIPDPTVAYEETRSSYEQTSSEFATTYGDMKEAELLSASGLDVSTDYESREQVLQNYADANPVSSDEDGDDSGDVAGGTVDTDTPASGASDGVDDGNTGDVAGETDNGGAPASVASDGVDDGNTGDVAGETDNGGAPASGASDGVDNGNTGDVTGETDNGGSPASGASDGVDNGNTGDVAGETDNGDAPASDEDVDDSGDDEESDATLRLSTEFPFLSDSGTETISGKYNGVDNYIYYDPIKTGDACLALLDYKEEFIDSFERIIEFDKFYSYLKSPYSDYVKNKTNYNSANTILREITTDLNDKMVSVKDTIEEIINAILAYSRDDFTGIDKLLGAGPFGGGPGGDDYFEDSDVSLDDINNEIENLGEDITTGGLGDTDDSKLSDDEKLVIPGYENKATSVIGAALSSTLDSSDELLELGEDVTNSDSLTGSIFNSDGKFLIPSFGAKNMVGESSGVKKSGIAIGGAVMAAASMAVGGKIFYDKKNEANDEMKSTADTDDTAVDIDDSADNDSEKTDNTNEEDTKSSDKNDKVFGKSVVKFKEALFDENDGSDIND